MEPWTTVFNPGVSTLERLVELTREVDFAAFVFAQDDWTTNSPPASPAPESGQASPRDNVVFEAGLAFCKTVLQSCEKARITLLAQERAIP